jgi:hypothetical protein
MKLQTAINHKQRLLGCVTSLVRSSTIMCPLSIQMNAEYATIMESVPKDCPAWVRSYGRGFYDCLREQMEQEHIEFCYPIHGVLYSTNKHTDRPRTERLYKKGLGRCLSKCQGYRYWKHKDKRYF